MRRRRNCPKTNVTEREKRRETVKGPASSSSSSYSYSMTASSSSDSTMTQTTVKMHKNK